LGNQVSTDKEIIYSQNSEAKKYCENIENNPNYHFLTNFYLPDSQTQWDQINRVNENNEVNFENCKNN
jgi:hypothetical protein